MIINSISEEDTIEVGIALGLLCKEGYVICLNGQLGTGKTQLVKGIAKGLQIEDYITSPTFIIVNEYKGRLPLYHFDVYRISDSAEMYEIGFDEYIYGDGVSVIEWADIIKASLPKEYININISKDLEQGFDFREIKIEAIGEKYSNFIDDFLFRLEE